MNEFEHDAEEVALDAAHMVVEHQREDLEATGRLDVASRVEEALATNEHATKTIAAAIEETIE